ncbi:SMC-Scp complex subunit ScpB [Candidatus Pacearchaeota archaeon]|nr:SMC-Scp complex subunit ScpB [Candidatus Pacearchaeota archaeon]
MENLTKETLDELDNARDLENMKKVEAALFVSGKFLTTQELVALTDLNPILLNQVLTKLMDKYDDGSAIEIVNKGDLWKMDIKGNYTSIVNKLATGNEEFTRAEQETLAVIAHKQPMKQSMVIQMRGNKAYDHIKRFTELGLIKSKRFGRTRELSLSDDFYDYFSVGKKANEIKEKESDKKDLSEGDKGKGE